MKQCDGSRSRGGLKALHWHLIGECEVLKKILPSLFSGQKVSGKKGTGALNMRGQTRMIQKRADAGPLPEADQAAAASETVKKVLETAQEGAAGGAQAKTSPQSREALIAEALEVRRQSAKILDDLDPKLRFRVVAAALAQTCGILEDDR